MIPIVILIVSLLVVSKSADWFLRSAEKIGVALGLSPFILGMILVGFGTSLPEMATSVAAVLDGVNTVTLPNVIGSNLVNVLVTVGVVSFILGTIRFEKDLIDIDLPLLASATALFIIMAIDGSVTRGEGIVLAIGFISYLLYAMLHREGREFHRGLIYVVGSLTRYTKGMAESHRVSKLQGSWIVTMLLSVGLLAVASKFAVDSAIDIARDLNILVDVVSFFAIAIGTSLPELVVSLRALKQRKGDIALGNIIGSSVFNLLFVAGIASILSEQHITGNLLYWMLGGLGLSVLLITTSGITKRIYVWEGFMFLLIYIAISMKIIAL